VLNSISQACGKLSFHISNYLHTQKEGQDFLLTQTLENSLFVATALNAIFPYHNLRNLSRSFKDNLANRLLCKLLEGKNQRKMLIFINFQIF
jgi:hypothetical protein